MEPTQSDKGSQRGIVAAIAAAAGLLAASAVANHQRARQAEREHPPAGRFIEIEGVRVHYIEQGLGPVVVLLHGVGVTAEDYKASGLLATLSQRHRVVAFDRPGYGYSERPLGRSWTAQAQADLLAQACTALGIERAVIVGHSWGTLVALQMALSHPHRVAGLVLVSGYYFPTPRVDSLLLGIPAIPVLGQLMRHTVSPALGYLLTPRMIRRMFAPNPVPDEFHAAVPLALMLRPGQLRAAAQDAGRMVATAAELSQRYSEVTTPTAIIAGNEDEVVQPDAQSAKLASVLPRAEIEMIPHGGHMLHHFETERVAEAVNRLYSQFDLIAGESPPVT